MENVLQQNHTIVNLPQWLCDFSAIRFDKASRRDTASKRTLADFVRGLYTKKTSAKDDLPAWSLCNDTGTDAGRPNGLIQLDFDHAADPEGLKLLLAQYPGILLAAVSASGKGVFALIYAPDHDGGLYAARHISGYLKNAGQKFDFDESTLKPCQLRFESYDPEPVIAPECVALAPDYDTALTRSGAREAFEVWTNGRPTRGDDYEAAVTAIFAASLIARVQVQYGLTDKPFKGGCDVQIVGKSGNAKTQGRIQPLRSLARQYGVECVGGLRATDASQYDDFIRAACSIEYDEKDKVKSVTVKEEPDRLANIMDESGDSETSRAGNMHKAQANLIRRIACFDGEINTGCTAEQKKYYRGLLPSILPANLVQYRATTANQLVTVDFADQMVGGNGRRTLYADQPEPERSFLASEDLKRKSERLLSQKAEMQLSCISEALKITCGGRDYVTFTATGYGCAVTRQAAKIAFERQQIPEEYADTIIYNTALYLAAMRCAIEYMTAANQTFEGVGTIPARYIIGNDIETATAIALNSFAVVRRLTASGAADKLATARTDTEKTRCIVEYIEGRKSGEIARGNLARQFGKDILANVESLCAEGVLTETIKVNADGRNPNTYYSVTPEADRQKAAKAYAQRKAERTPKARPRDDSSVWDGNAHGKRYDEASDEDKENRILAYIQKYETDHPLKQEGARNDSFNRLIFQLKHEQMWDETAQEIVRRRAEDAGLPEREIKTLMRQRKSR